MDLERERSVAESLARAAGAMALRMRAQPLVIDHKANDEGPVSNADIAIDKFIVEKLLQFFPHDKIISEESFHSKDDLSPCPRVWFVDPIDGTASYIAGMNDFVVMIGLAVDGIPQLGIIYEPCRDRLWGGIAGQGYAYKYENDQRFVIKLTSRSSPKEISIIGSRTHRSARQNALIALLHPKQVQYQSSVGLKAMLILEGIADLYVAWSKRIKLWDSCAPSAIIHAASGHISFIDGAALKYTDCIEHRKAILIANFVPEKPLYDILKKIASL